MSSVTKSIPVCSVEIRDSDHNFKFQTEIKKLEKSVLLDLPNLEYHKLQNNYQHLKDIKINDHDKKSVLPVHVISGVNDYTTIKTQERQRVGLPWEPIAELTKQGWVTLWPGKENASTNILFIKTSLHGYENLCGLDCLGIEEKHEKNNEFMYGEFRKQLGRDSFENYETNLIWKENHPPLRSKEVNSLGRLHNLTKNLILSNKLGEYDKIIQEQINEGIIESVSETKTSEKGKEFYLPHRPVIRESAETSKIRIVYDASAKPNKDSVSLNECLETDPPLQNSPWDILIRSRFRPILLCGYTEKAFLQIRIRESERDVSRLHWAKNSDPSVIEINRFTRLVFGLTQSPFILEGTLKEHFQYYIDEYPTLKETISEDMYVDDLVPGSNTIEEVEVIKQKSIELFGKGGFNLHKWHPNIPSLQSSNIKSESELTYYL